MPAWCVIGSRLRVSTLAAAHQFLGRPVEAEAVFRQAFERNAVFHYTLIARFNLAFAVQDQAEMEQAASVARKNPHSILFGTLSRPNP